MAIIDYDLAAGHRPYRTKRCFRCKGEIRCSLGGIRCKICGRTDPEKGRPRKAKR